MIDTRIKLDIRISVIDVPTRTDIHIVHHRRTTYSQTTLKAETEKHRGAIISGSVELARRTVNNRLDFINISVGEDNFPGGYVDPAIGGDSLGAKCVRKVI